MLIGSRAPQTEEDRHAVWRRPFRTWPWILRSLAAEALKAGSFATFERDYTHQIKHGDYWHWTDNPGFVVDPALGPRDMSSMAPHHDAKPGSVMFTSHLEYWSEYGGPQRGRPYAALLDLRAVPREAYRQVSRGFGNEFILENTAAFDIPTVRVYPRQQAFDTTKRWDRYKPASRAELQDFYERVVQLGPAVVFAHLGGAVPAMPTTVGARHPAPHYRHQPHQPRVVRVPAPPGHQFDLPPEGPHRLVELAERVPARYRKLIAAAGLKSIAAQAQDAYDDFRDSLIAYHIADTDPRNAAALQRIEAGVDRFLRQALWEVNLPDDYGRAHEYHGISEAAMLRSNDALGSPLHIIAATLWAQIAGQREAHARDKRDFFAHFLRMLEATNRQHHLAAPDVWSTEQYQRFDRLLRPFRMVAVRLAAGMSWPRRFLREVLEALQQTSHPDRVLAGILETVPLRLES